MNPPRKTSSSRSSHEKEVAPLSLDYNHISRLCLKYWKWLAGGVILGFLAGYFYADSQTPIYAARSTIVVNSKNTNAGLDAVGQPDGISDDMIKTYEQMLQTRNLAQRVVKAQTLNESPEFLPDVANLPVSEDTATGILTSETHIQIRPLTRLIDITVEHPSPEMTAKLANWLAQAAISQQVDQSAGTTTLLSDDLQKDVERIQGELSVSESALKAYDASHNIMEGVANDAEDASDNELKDLNRQYEDAQAQVSLLQERYGPKHPKLIAAQNLVEELQDKLNKAQSNAVDTSGQNADYSTLKSKVEANKATLAAMLRELQGAQAAAHVEIPGIAVEEEATRPWVPVRPNKTKSAAVGGFIGLICGLTFVLGVYFMDSSLRTVSQAENTLGLPVIAAIPILTETDGRTVLPTFSDPQSFVAESFRGLRASLILHDRANPLKTVLVGSAIPGEGKSFCAANLAVAFAQAGLKTLLIDADLRLPTLHTYFNIPPDQAVNGFLEVLSGRATLETAAVASPIPTLSLLLTTTPADSPAELLSGIRLPLLLDEAAQKYDRVVIDSAPLNAVSDTMLILPKTDAILLVVRAAQTPSSESKAALQKVYSSNMKPLGLLSLIISPPIHLNHTHMATPMDKSPKIKMQSKAHTPNWFLHTQRVIAVIAVLFAGFTAARAQAEAAQGDNAGAGGYPVAAVSSTYTLSPYDVIDVSVYNEEDLHTRARLGADGTALLPLIGTLSLGGLTVTEANDLIRKRYADGFVKDPHVLLTVLDYRKSTFSILGQVVKPGIYEIPEGTHMSIVDAILLAGGFTRLAAQNGVKVKRMVKGKAVVFKVHAGSMADDASVPPFDIQPGDIIKVSESWW